MDYKFEIEKLEVRGTTYFKITNNHVDIPILMAERKELITELEIYMYALKNTIKYIKEKYDYNSCEII